MHIPPFTASGDLPVGLHPATLQEIKLRFGATTTQRQIMAARLEHIYRTAAGTGHLARFVIFGSFVTAKLEPNDVDVFLLMKDSFDSATLVGEAKLLFDHGNANTYFGASVFWLRRIAAFGGEQAAIENWQIKRDGSLRGIVEIIGE
ncbi:MAG TPA: hypothetical protein VFA07_18615 [Chthonomonadaceae bacterium]|nr:hypothetical protein [Chthonomonadaceae bacterium]